MKLSNASPKEIETLEHYLIALPMERNVIKKFVEYIPVENTLNAATYIQEVVNMRAENFGLETGRVMCLADLGWDKEVKWALDVTFAKY